MHLFDGHFCAILICGFLQQKYQCGDSGLREIVQNIINGEYDFSGNVGPLAFSVEQIVVDVLPGQVTYGSFYVMCDDGITRG